MVFKKVPVTVFILGLVSFFNDLASEMIYPIVPLFLTTVLHTSIPIIGFIEGIAEAIASITKYFFGTYSDFLKKRKIFITFGYSFGAISKLLIGLAYVWPLVLFARVIDRLGKGLRTAPRDSLLLENTTQENKGFIFGFHRAFDSLGAVFGPLAALIILILFKNNLRLTFFIAFIPGVIAILLLVFLIKEKKKIRMQKERRFVKIDWKLLQPRLIHFILISFIFALGNSSDTFLLLNAKKLGLSTTLVVLTYVSYNLSQTIFATPAGYLADKLGARKIFTAGLIVFTFVYLLFGVIKNPIWLWVLFPIYGIYVAATDGVSKAYIAEFITISESGTFFGAYYTITAIGTFFASVIGGILWTTINPSATFIYGSIMAFIAFCLLIIFQKEFKSQ
ncbi:MAG TPA: MFS transporter [Candidatus Sulfotelmatobacter sp.]|jgi:MFS family permease|nr:MFS transporter [Candidatus Sulfotelmatobacter sp.]